MKTIVGILDENTGEIEDALKGGRMGCLVCHTLTGFYIRKYHKGIQSKWTRTYICANCGSKERHSHLYENNTKIDNQIVCCPEGLKVGDLVKWNGDISGRVDKITSFVKGMFGGWEYYTLETNPQEGQKAKIGKQFYDKDNQYMDKGIILVKE